jgi:hypothetical protein
MSIIDDGSRERAADNIAKLRTRFMTAREAAAELGREREGVARELGVSRVDAEGAYGPRAESVLGRLGTLRLARLRASSDKPSAEELRLAARRDVLESALAGMRRESSEVSSRLVDAQNAFEQAVGLFERDYPVAGPFGTDIRYLEPVG